jgi:hypothetical protein
MNYLAFRISSDATLKPAGFASDENIFLRPNDEARMFGYFQLNALSRLAKRISGNSLVHAGISVQHAVNEQCQLTVAQVREVVTAAHFDWLVVEKEFDGRFRVAVNVPEERGTLVLDSVLSIRFLFIEKSQTIKC